MPTRINIVRAMEKSDRGPALIEACSNHALGGGGTAFICQSVLAFATRVRQPSLKKIIKKETLSHFS